MANVFNFCGKIALGKQTDKFSPIDRREFNSGWTNTTLKFNCISGTNRILCTSQGGKWVDDKKNVIKTFGKSTTDENGKVTKGETIEIPWAKRFDEDQIDKVAGFRKFVCDTGDTRMRYKLQNLINALENGSVTDEMIEEVGIDNIEDAKTALEKSVSKKKIFLSEWDFAEHLAKVAQSEKFRNKLFYISGTYDIQYNADKDRFYTNYHVNRVVLAPDDAVPSTEFKIDFYFSEGACDDSSYDETGKAILNGWTNYYDASLKKTGFKDIAIAVREDEKKLNALMRKFNIEGDEVKQIGLTLNVIEGAERVEITMEMLDEETREDIEAGLLDFEDVKRELGGKVVGDKLSELRFVELTPKKNTVQDTMYNVDDMHPAKVEIVENEDDTEDVNFDIFDDNDDDLDDDL